MNMKIITTTTQLCSRFGAHPQYFTARAEMILGQMLHDSFLVICHLMREPSHVYTPYLIIVIFFTLTQFLENKIYTKKTRKLQQNTQ